jgi:hypothetical protein
MHFNSMTIPDPHLIPEYWNQLSGDDKSEFLKLRANFRQGQKMSSKDRRVVTFRRELHMVRDYLERSSGNREARCIIAGVCFVGPYVCINTRQLKSFLSRCKSSINGSFQQLGFIALRTKSKAKNCVIAALPSLRNQQDMLRQWTVRWTSEQADFCFVTSFSCFDMPEIAEEDLFDEAPGRPINISVPIARKPLFAPKPVAPFKPRTIGFDLPTMEPFESPEPEVQWKMSWSMESFEAEFDESIEVIMEKEMRRSESAHLTMSEWRIFDDEPAVSPFSL